MGAPVGNQNGAKAKQWSAAIERALERRGDPTIDPDQPFPRGPRAKALDELAELFIERMVLQGDISFFREFADRLQGKAAQEITGADGGPLVVIQATAHDESL